MSPIIALPVELELGVLQMLDLRGRIAVSHVCSAWRRAALGDPALWTEFQKRTKDYSGRHVDDDTTLFSALFLPEPLANAFPIIRELKLRGVTNASLPRLVPLPSAIELLDLGMAEDFDDSDLEDYSSILRDCGARAPRKMHLHEAASALGVFELFTRTIGGPWECDVNPYIYCYLSFTGITLTSASSDVPVEHFVVAPNTWLSREPSVLSFCAQLRKLSLSPLSAFVDLWSASASAGNTIFPMLENMTIFVDIHTFLPGGVRTARRLSALAEGPSIDVPKLDALAFRQSWTTDCPTVASIVLLVHALRSPALGSIVFTLKRRAEEFLRQDLSPLLLLADRFAVVDERAGEEHLFEHGVPQEAPRPRQIRAENHDQER
ncbi:hypothetical protein AURDEDRAFT_168108 [Auricularia subglabra TFB-10046 SS5]|nr:hypothetical protein AURDEDRAFT_168108 [Auricularia subglabra TFB-10046 SS5]